MHESFVHFYTEVIFIVNYQENFFKSQLRINFFFLKIFFLIIVGF